MQELNREIWMSILEEIGIIFNEGEVSIQNIDTFPYLVFWDYLWENISASNQIYDTLITYQVSIFNTDPPKKNKKLISLIQKLNKLGYKPLIQHEYIIDEKIWHSYFKIELTENVI